MSLCIEGRFFFKDYDFSLENIEKLISYLNQLTNSNVILVGRKSDYRSMEELADDLEYKKFSAGNKKVRYGMTFSSDSVYYFYFRINYLEKEELNLYENLFLKLCSYFDCQFAVLGLNASSQLCISGYHITEALTGIAWITVFGDIFIKEFSRRKLLELPAFKVFEFESMIAIKAYEDIELRYRKRMKIVNKIKIILEKEYFYDLKKESKTIRSFDALVDRMINVKNRYKQVDWGL